MDSYASVLESYLIPAEEGLMDKIKSGIGIIYRGIINFIRKLREFASRIKNAIMNKGSSNTNSSERPTVIIDLGETEKRKLQGKIDQLSKDLRDEIDESSKNSRKARELQAEIDKLKQQLRNSEDINRFSSERAEITNRDKTVLRFTSATTAVVSNAYPKFSKVFKTIHNMETYDEQVYVRDIEEVLDITKSSQYDTWESAYSNVKSAFIDGDSKLSIRNKDVESALLQMCEQCDKVLAYFEKTFADFSKKTYEKSRANTGEEVKMMNMLHQEIVKDSNKFCKVIQDSLQVANALIKQVRGY